MRRSTRFGLVAAFAAAFAFPTSARAAEPDKLLPADADTILSVNVRQIIDSDIVKKYAIEQMKQFLQGNDAQTFLKEIGLDPLKDLDRVVVAGSGKDQATIKGLVIVHGKFDAEKLYKAAEAQSKKEPDKFALVKEGKDVMFKLTPDSGNPVYGTVVDNNTIIVGTDKKIISTALAAANADKKPTVDKKLSAMIAKMDDKASVWVVALVNGRLDNAKIPGGMNQNLQGQLANMDSVSAVVRVTADVSIDVTMTMKDDASADEMGKAIEDVLTQIKGFAPLLAANDPKMKPLADAAKSLKSTTKNRDISISAKIPGSAIGALLNMGQ